MCRHILAGLIERGLSSNTATCYTVMTQQECTYRSNETHVGCTGSCCGIGGYTE